MSKHEHILDIYASISAKTGEMVEAAKSSDWDRLVTLEQDCRALIERLKCSDAGAAVGAQFVQRKIKFIRKALADDAMDIINLKISKVGGLTKARLMRDICVASGTPMTIEDTWGGDIVTATIAHLARSTPEEFCFSATDFNSYGTVDIATGAPKRLEGFMTTGDSPGLGIVPIFDVLGDPVVVVS